MVSNRSVEELQLNLDLDSEFFIAEKSTLDTVTVKEVYSIGNGLVVKNIGTWSKLDGLKILQPDKYERRSNLSGVNLQVAVTKVSF